MEGAASQSGSAFDESQGVELAEHAGNGESSHTDRLIHETGTEETGMSAAAEDAANLEEKDLRNDAEGESELSNLNACRVWDERDSQRSGRDLQSTLKLGDAVEDDARAVARSLTALLASLKSALSEATGSSLEHMRAENEAAGQVQDVAIDAATKGNRFINACLRLNEEMKGMNTLTTQLAPVRESLKQRVDQFEYQSNRYLPRQ